MPVRKREVARSGAGRVAGLLLLAALLAGCGTKRAPVESVTIVADPGRFGTIEAAAAAENSIDWWTSGGGEDADRCTECFAATELARFLPAALGIAPDRVKLTPAKSAAISGHMIFVGAKAAIPHDVPTRLQAMPEPVRLGYETDLVAAYGESFLGASVIVIEGHTRTGTLAGAYALLETLGVRFYDLGDSNAVMPAKPAEWPTSYPNDVLSKISGPPAYDVRGFWAWEPRGSNDFFLWMARNRMNLWTAAEPRAAFLEKLGIRLTAGGHGLESEFLDPARNFAKHPEWFGFENGKRQPGIFGESGLNFCTSNSAAVAEFARGIVASLASGTMRRADVVQLWPLDGGRWCTCDACRATGGPQDRWLAVAAAVKREIASARAGGRLRRDVLVMSSAYLDTSAPPTRRADEALEQPGSTVTFFPYFRCYAHALGDPACYEINRPIAARFIGWVDGGERGYRGNVAIGEYYNVSWTKSLPVVFPHVMATDLADLSNLGVREFFTMHAPTSRWGTWTLQHAMLARLLWNPRANVDSLVADFCAREYAGVGDEMRAFYAALEAATANLVALQQTVGSIGTGERIRLLDGRVPVFQLRHISEAPHAKRADTGASLVEIEQSMRDARAALDAAHARARDPHVVARLGEVDARFRYGDAMLRFWIALIRGAVAWREKQGDALASQVARADSSAAELRGITDLVQVAASHANARNGYEASGATRVYEAMRTLARNRSTR